MTNMSWWRSWHGAPMDHKWSVISSRSGVKAGIVSAVVWALLDCASQHKDRGCIDDFDIEVYSVFSGFDETEVAAVIKALIDKEIIINNRFTNWEKRQPKSETEIQRVTDYRKKKRKESERYDLLQDVTENYTEKIKIKDTDKESDEDINKSSSSIETTTTNIFRIYEQEVAPLTPFIAETLDDIEKEYPEGWFQDAVKEAKQSSTKVSIRYIEAILKRWKAEGRSNGHMTDREYVNPAELGWKCGAEGIE
jgi:DnaD/phage-associated family protein